MDLALVLLGFILMWVGIVGSIVPVLPGLPISWLGLFLLYMTQVVPDDWWVLSITLVLAIGITVLDYSIPAIGTKRFGGSPAGIWGTVAGLIFAVVFPVFRVLGIIIWPFIGALVGELLNKANQKTALKAAFGSFLGFLAGTFIKLLVSVLYAMLYVYVAVQYTGELFSFS